MRTSLTAFAAAALLLAGSATAMADPAGTSGRASGPAESSTAVDRFYDSFESPNVKADTFIDFVTGRSFGPWRVTSGSVELTTTRLRAESTATCGTPGQTPDR